MTTPREPRRTNVLDEISALRDRVVALERARRGYSWDPVSGAMDVPGPLTAGTLSFASHRLDDDAFAAADALTLYPFGASFMPVSSLSGWPETYGVVTTHRSETVPEDYNRQVFTSMNVNPPRVYYRRWIISTASWTEWAQLTNAGKFGQWTRSTTQSIPWASETVLVPNTTQIDPFDDHFTISSGTITVQRAGIIEYGATCQWETTDGGRRYMVLKKNGAASALEGKGVDSMTATVSHQVSSGPISASAGDTLNARVYQNQTSGAALGALNITVWAKYLGDL